MIGYLKLKYYSTFFVTFHYNELCWVKVIFVLFCKFANRGIGSEALKLLRYMWSKDKKQHLKVSDCYSAFIENRFQ